MPLDMERRKAWTKAYTKEVRDWRRLHGICTLCGSQDAVHGFSQCPACQQVTAERNEKYKDSKRKADKRRYENRKRAGVCTVCGNPIDGPHKLCEKCHARKMKRDRSYRREKHIAPVHIDGRCVLCGDIAVHGSKLCQRHYDSACANLVLARSAINKVNHFWHVRENSYFRNKERAANRNVTV